MTFSEAVGMFVSGNVFDLLGVGAARGRTLKEADEESGGTAVVVLSPGTDRTKQY